MNFETFQFTVAAKNLRLIRENIFGIENETVKMIETYDSSVSAIDRDIQTARDLCISLLGLSQCTRLTPDTESSVQMPTTVR